jgi:hypothetical protein
VRQHVLRRKPAFDTQRSANGARPGAALLLERWRTHRRGNVCDLRRLRLQLELKQQAAQHVVGAVVNQDGTARVAAE